jgi:hypothetical protein
MTSSTKKTGAVTSTTISTTTYPRDNNNSSSMIDSYIKNIRIMSKGTSHEYLTRLNSFNTFIKNEFDDSLTVNDLLTKIKQGQIDTYDVLSKFSGYLQSSYNITTLTLKQRVVTVKNFFEYFDI